MSFYNHIEDIKYSKSQVYMLKKQTLTSTQVESQIRDYPYSGVKQYRNESLDNVKIPPIISVFYTILFMQNKVPSSEELISFYTNIFFDFNNDSYQIKPEYRAGKENPLFDINSIKARILRTYPSLVRDFHFYLLCCESDYFDNVYYSLKKDFVDGIDVDVVYKGETYGVSLHTKTNKSLFYKNKKYFRHSYAGIKEIDLTLELNSRKMTGSFFLYDTSHIEKLVKEIQNYKVNDGIETTFTG